MMPRNNWLKIAVCSLLAIGGEAYLCFGLAFNPGWANGWPNGRSIHSVWSTVMTMLFILFLSSVAVGLGAILCAGMDRGGVSLSKCRAIYVGWLVASSVFTWRAGHWAYAEVYALTLTMWPNGYNH